MINAAEALRSKAGCDTRFPMRAIHPRFGEFAERICSKPLTLNLLYHILPQKAPHHRKFPHRPTFTPLPPPTVLKNAPTPHNCSKTRRLIRLRPQPYSIRPHFSIPSLTKLPASDPYLCKRCTLPFIRPPLPFQNSRIVEPSFPQAAPSHPIRATHSHLPTAPSSPFLLPLFKNRHAPYPRH